MIPVSTLYDEYIERRKFTEQKKNPFEYIVPPPSRGSEQLALEGKISKMVIVNFKNIIMVYHVNNLYYRKMETL